MSTVREALPCVLPVLTDLISRSLQSSIFPSAWKISEVVPLVKEGDHAISSNIKQTCIVISCDVKSCERIVLNQLNSYMIKEKRLTRRQSGNKHLHSCETLGVFITNKVFNAMDSQELTVIVLLDFSKAFDSIGHCKLIAKLQALGLSLSALEWFRSYLTDRKQQTRIGSVLSELGNITHGVSQGSILGPALFNIYLNDLPTMPISGALESFEDDSKLYLSFPVKNAGDVMRKSMKIYQKLPHGVATIVC